MFICLRPPPLIGFCLGSSSNFVGSESGLKKNVKLLPNMVSNTTQHPPPPPSHTLSVQSVLWLWGGGKVNQRVGQRGNSSQSWTVSRTVRSAKTHKNWMKKIYDHLLPPGGHKDMSSILADQYSALVLYKPKCGGGGSCVAGPQSMCVAQINFGDLPPYITYGYHLWIKPGLRASEEDL